MSYTTIKFSVIIDFVYIDSAIMLNNKDESPGIFKIFLQMYRISSVLSY
jgi:hypothetical protein